MDKNKRCSASTITRKLRSYIVFGKLGSFTVRVTFGRLNENKNRLWVEIQRTDSMMEEEERRT